MLCKIEIFLFLFILGTSSCFSQIGYKKDSVQIKVYTTVLYENKKPTTIKVVKVFCDYCTEKQLEKVKLKAWKASHKLLFHKDYYMDNGLRKITHFIRFKREGF